MIEFINTKLKSKFGPLLLAGATILFLVAALILSGSYSRQVFAQTKLAVNPPATSAKTPANPVFTKTPATAPVVGNANAPTGENVDLSGKSGFVICGNTADTPCNITHLFRILIIIINYLISMAGLVAILFIIIAGIQMIISQGAIPGKAGDQTQLTLAKKRLAGAVTGLILVAVAFVLVNTLLAGSLNIGIRNGSLILTNPRAYINNCSVDANGKVDPSCTTPSSTTQSTTGK